MRARRLLWQLYPSYVVLIVLSLFAVAWHADRALRRQYVESATEELGMRARLVRSFMGLPVVEDRYPAIARLCEELARDTGGRITVVHPSGAVIADSHEETAARVAPHLPEVSEALAGRTGVAERRDPSEKRRVLFVAVPVNDGVTTVAAVRVSAPLDRAGEITNLLYGTAMAAALAAILLAVPASAWVSRRFVRPVEHLRRGVARYAEGELGHRLAVPESPELRGLAGSLNEMAERLEERMREIVRQRGRDEAVLASMIEGVLAVDADERILTANEAAAELFGFDYFSSLGKRVQEVVRNNTLHEVVASTLRDGTPAEGEITLYGDEERILQVHGTALRDPRSQSFGALLVFNDITRLRRLEKVRRDFVANVSHELKTPVTTIKGFVETLVGGAMHSREDAERFLKIILRHTDRLNAIIEDLLSLSRIEQESDKAEILREEVRLKEVLGRAVDLCRSGAQVRRIEVRLDGDETVVCRINSQLVEQAVVNLIDNAIKYSDEGSVVEVSVQRVGGEVAIRVRDHGCGIEAEHFPRLFERFYRTDRARSRALGGTGLGLAIVKHIALAHGGRVGVESKPGAGSVFSIFLPSY